MKNSKPEKFLEIEELSALENETLRGGQSTDNIEVKKEKKKQKSIQ